MKKTIFTGSAVAIVTPMNEDGSINYDNFADRIEEQICRRNGRYSSVRYNRRICGYDRRGA